MFVAMETSRSRSMVRVALFAAATAVLASWGFAAEAAPGLLGKWRAVRIEKGGERRGMPPGVSLLLEFKRSGEFITRMRVRSKGKVERGIWKVNGKQPVTTVAGKTEKMSYHIDKKTLRLDNEARKTVLLLERR